MKTNKDDGAFAMAGEGGFQLGLSKREYFAAMAMQGLTRELFLDNPENIAEMSIAQADALIAELNKEEK